MCRTRQLLVPLFMLLIIVVCNSALLVELEWSYEVDRCINLWYSVSNISLSFMRSHPKGIDWDCSICDADRVSLAHSPIETAAADREQLCRSCLGHPAGYPECHGVRWMQSYPE